MGMLGDLTTQLIPRLVRSVFQRFGLPDRLD
jgi:hypothetical protein